MIAICEPQCVGFEHVEVNAPFLAAVRTAFPDEKIIFLAEESHLHNVRHKLELKLISGLEYRPVQIPPTYTADRRRLPRELRLWKEILDLGNFGGTDRLIFTSMTSSGLIALKLLMRSRRSTRCTIILHGLLASIASKPPSHPLKRPFWFRYSLGFGHTDRIRYIVLGESIRHELCDRMPHIRHSIYSIDMPYFFESPKAHEPFQENTMRFGYLGVSRRDKCTDSFIDLARQIRQLELPQRSEFYLIGHVIDIHLPDSYAESVIVPAVDRPLDREEYEHLIQNLDYAVYLYDPKSYQLRASASLFDAFSHLKPIIALRNPFFEYYFRSMGNIGYMCDSHNEVATLIQRILNERPVEEYLLQRENISKGREKLSHVVLSNLLSQIMCHEP